MKHLDPTDILAVAAEWGNPSNLDDSAAARAAETARAVARSGAAIAEVAAHLAVALLRQPPLPTATERVAMTAALLFLERNGFELAADPATMAKLVRAVVTGSASAAALLARFDELVVPQGGLLSQLTPDARAVLSAANAEALALRHNFIGTEHVLLALLQLSGTAAARALSQLGVEYTSMRGRVAELIGPTSAQVSGRMPFTPRTKRVIEIALRHATGRQADAGDLLMALCREGQGVAAQLLEAGGHDTAAVWSALTKSQAAAADPRLLSLYLDDVESQPRLSDDDVRALARQGDTNAQRRLVESHLRFVVEIAEANRRGRDLLDLIQEGNLALLRAVEEYDASAHGEDFTAYVRDRVTDAVIPGDSRTTPDPACSFCNKATSRLVAGPNNVTICATCVTAAQAILDNHSED